MAKKNTPPIQNVMHEIIIYAANVLKNINKDIKTWIGDDFCCNLIKILKNVIYAWNCKKLFTALTLVDIMDV